MTDLVPNLSLVDLDGVTHHVQAPDRYRLWWTACGRGYDHVSIRYQLVEDRDVDCMACVAKEAQ